MLAARRMRCEVAEDEARTLLAHANYLWKKPSRIRKADDLAEWLGVDKEQREELELRTIGDGRGKRARTRERKAKAQARERKRRLQAGARPHSESAARTMPWKALGIDRATCHESVARCADIRQAAAAASHSAERCSTAKGTAEQRGVAQDRAPHGRH
jgi:hypothetical protein